MRAKLPGMLPIMDPDKGPGTHSTPTLDLITVSSGRGVLILDDGSATELAPGDCIIQRGTTHAWATSTPVSATVVVAVRGGAAVGQDHGGDPGRVEFDGTDRRGPPGLEDHLPQPVPKAPRYLQPLRRAHLSTRPARCWSHRRTVPAGRRQREAGCPVAGWFAKRWTVAAGAGWRAAHVGAAFGVASRRVELPGWQWAAQRSFE